MQKYDRGGDSSESSIQNRWIRGKTPDEWIMIAGVPPTCLHGYDRHGVFSMNTENVLLTENQFGMKATPMQSRDVIMQKLLEKDTIINELTIRLNEFERKKSFAPSRHRLPLDYYDNDIYLDE